MLQRIVSPLFAAAVIILSGLSAAAPAAAEKRAASEFLQNLAAEAVAVLSDKQISAETRQRAFRNLIHRGFDFPVVSRFVLGRHWRRANAAERAEFMRLFEDYIVATYARRLGNYSGEGLQITKERAIKTNGAQVSSRIALKDGRSVNVDWRLSRRSGQWRIVDVVVEGVSLVLVQRSEFNSVIRRGGGKLAALLALLEKKTATANPTRTASN
jgi:phospholipid transport system substrate-binding protein